MEKQTEKKNISNILKYSGCIVAIALAVFFGMQLYKNALPAQRTNPFSDKVEKLVAQTADGENSVNGAGGQNSIPVDNGDLTSEKTDENSQNESDKTAVDDSEYDSSGNSAQPENSVNAQNIADNITLTNSSTEKTGQAGGINSQVKPEESDSDVAFFKTTIKNNEVVNSTAYAFEIIQLQKEYRLRSTTVLINGSEVAQFSGKCGLSEGKNIIRVVCVYTSSDNKIKRTYKDYTVYCYSCKIGFSTDLENMETANSQLKFNGAAYYGKTEIELNVSLNGRKIEGEKSYLVTLENGENIFKLTAEYKGIKGEKSFTVTYNPTVEFQLVTDLYDQTVHSDGFTFTAKMAGNSDSAKLAVAVNGKSVKGSDGTYNVTLENGANNIVLRAKDGGQTIDRAYTITYTPPVDESTKPIISYINVTDEMTVKGSAFSLALTAQDFEGQRIYADKIKVYLNGKLSVSVWQDSSQTGYYLQLSAGANSLGITVTDYAGRTEEYFYTINCQQASQGEEIGRIQFQFDGATLGLNNLAQNSEISFAEGENAVDTIKKFLEENGYTADFTGSEDTGYYLSRIYKDGAFAGAAIQAELEQLLSADGIGKTGQASDDSLGELDYTQGAGWIISVNGKVVPYGISQIHFADGDIVRLTFTLGYGKDIEGAENGYEKRW